MLSDSSEEIQGLVPTTPNISYPSIVQLSGHIPPAWHKLVPIHHLHEVDNFIKKEHERCSRESGKKCTRASVLPQPHAIFRALELVEHPDRVKVVIIGQDPYIRPNQATGLAFGVPRDTHPLPPSLKNIMKRLGVNSMNADRCQLTFDVTLEDWVRQGVLLLNTALTVGEGSSNSHASVWKPFTNEFVKHFAQYRHDKTSLPPLVFLLWGAHAIKTIQTAKLETMRHVAVCCSHPSPLSCGRGVQGFPPFLETSCAKGSRGSSSDMLCVTSTPTAGSDTKTNLFTGSECCFMPSLTSSKGCFDTCNKHLKEFGSYPICWIRKDRGGDEMDDVNHEFAM